MTTAHKTILSLVAAICITLIVFYSIKGNTEHPGSGAQIPSMSATTKSSPHASSPRDNRSSQTPMVIARADDQKPGSIDDIMAKVKQLDETKSSSASTIKAHATASETVSPPAPALSNTPASTEAPIVPLSEASASPSEATPATESPAEAGATSLTPAPATVPDPIASTPSANAAAAVPSITIGESTPSSTTEATAGEPTTGEKPRSVFEADVKDLAELPAIADPLPVPALAKVEPPAETVKAKDEATPAASTPAKSASEKSNETVTPTPAPAATPDTRVILVDPHKTAVEVNDETVAAPAPAKSNDAAAVATVASSNIVADSAKRSPLPEAPKAPAASSATARTYTIKAGDTFSSIAVALYGAEKHWIDIADANPTIDAKKVRVGQVIKLPEIDKDEVKPVDAKAAAKPVDPKADVKPESKTDAKTEAKVDAKSAAKPAVSKTESAKVEARIHEVKSGENLISISRRYYKNGDNWRHIYLTNRELIGGDPAKLHAGMKLKITPAPLED